jgi:hypothetical protein
LFPNHKLSLDFPSTKNITFFARISDPAWYYSVKDEIHRRTSVDRADIPDSLWGVGQEAAGVEALGGLFITSDSWVGWADTVQRPQILVSGRQVLALSGQAHLRGEL